MTSLNPSPLIRVHNGYAYRGKLTVGEQYTPNRITVCIEFVTIRSRNKRIRSIVNGEEKRSPISTRNNSETRLSADVQKNKLDKNA